MVKNAVIGIETSRSTTRTLTNRSFLEGNTRKFFEMILKVSDDVVLHSIFLDFVNRPVFYRIQSFGNWMFPLQLGGWETSTLLGPIERANINRLRTQ
jgi:hypothetical protein